VEIVRILSIVLLVGAAHAEGDPTRGTVLDVVTCKGIEGVRITGTAFPIGPAGARRLETRTGPGGEFEFLEQVVDLKFDREGYRTSSRMNGNPAHCRWDRTYPMMPISILYGTVVDEFSRPVPNAAIVAYLLSGRGYAVLPTDHIRTTADVAGKFALEMKPFPANLSITDPRCKTADGILHNPERRRVSLTEVVRLDPSEHRTAVFRLSPVPAHTVRGRIDNYVPQFPRGAIRIGLESRTTCPSLWSSLDQRGGAFSFEAVPAGTYRLRITLHQEYDGDCCADPRYADYVVFRDITVPATNRNPIAISIYPGAEIHGTIHWEGTPVGSYDWPRVGIVSSNSGHSDEQRGEDRNSFRLARVQPGRYGLQVQDLRAFSVREVRLNGKPVSLYAIEIPSEMREASLELYMSLKEER